MCVVHHTLTYQYPVAAVHRMECDVMWEGAHEWRGMIENGGGMTESWMRIVDVRGMLGSHCRRRHI